MQPIYCLYTGTVQSAQRVGYRLDNPRFDSWQGQEILLSKMSRSALGRTQPSIQWVPCHLHLVPAFKSIVLCVVPRYAFMTCTGTELSFLSELRRWLRHCATDSCNMASSLQLFATFKTCICHTSVFHIYWVYIHKHKQLAFLYISWIQNSE